jgi:hypothetical protein
MLNILLLPSFSTLPYIAGNSKKCPFQKNVFLFVDCFFFFFKEKNIFSGCHGLILYTFGMLQSLSLFHTFLNTFKEEKHVEVQHNQIKT